MPYDIVECPSCNAEVPNGTYCKSCGQLLQSDERSELKEIISSDKEIPTSDPIDTQQETEQIVIPVFSFSIAKMDDRSKAILFSGAELEVLNKELDVLIEKIRATRQALDLDHADKELLATRALELRATFDKSKQRRDELNQVKGTLVLKTLLDDFETCDSKLTKLDEIEKTLDPAVYQEERSKLISLKKDLEKQVKTSLKVARQWIKGMYKKLKELRKELSRLDAKLKIGDISVTAFDDRKYRAERSIHIIEMGMANLEKLILSAKVI